MKADHIGGGQQIGQRDKGARRIAERRAIPPYDAEAQTTGKTSCESRVTAHETHVLPGDLSAQILPRGHSASDSRWLLVYFRKDAAGRFIMGGRGNYSAAATRHQMQVLRDASLRLYPTLRDIRWRYAWGASLP